MGARHLGGDATLIQEHQPFCGDGAHLLAVSLALGGNLGPLLLGRPKGLFFGRSLSRLSASQITARHTVTPVLSARRSRYSRSSASLSSATSWRSTSRTAASRREGTPPLCGFGARRPSSRSWRRQFDTVAGQTWKRRAIST